MLRIQVVAENEMDLSLVEQEDNTVTLNGKDAQGRTFAIASVSDAGLQLLGGIPVDSGWPITSDGKIILVP